MNPGDTAAGGLVIAVQQDPTNADRRLALIFFRARPDYHVNEYELADGTVASLLSSTGYWHFNEAVADYLSFYEDVDVCDNCGQGGPAWTTPAGRFCDLACGEAYGLL